MVLFCNIFIFVAEKRRQEQGEPGDCIAVCTGFHRNATKQEIVNYLYDNHENVIDVNMDVSTYCTTGCS